MIWVEEIKNQMCGDPVSKQFWKSLPPKVSYNFPTTSTMGNSNYGGLVEYAYIWSNYNITNLGLPEIEDLLNHHLGWGRVRSL